MTSQSPRHPVPEDKTPAEPPNSPPIDSALIDSDRQYIKSREPVYQTQARTAGFAIDFGDKTCFDHERIVTVIGLKQLRKIGIELGEELDFSVLHETKHYEDFAREPDTYQKLIDKGNREDGLGQHYFRLYNCTEDIAVNTRVAYDSPHFRQGAEFSPLVKDMYRNKLFKERDWQKRPKSQQFADYILNAGMGVADDITLSEEVSKIVTAPISVYGKKMDLPEFIDTYLRPAPPGQSAYGNSLEKRLQIVDKFLLPLFESLVELDKREGREKQLVEGDGTPTPGSSTFDDFKKAVETFKNKAKEKNLTPKERAERQRKNQINDLAKGAGLTTDETNDFYRIYQRSQEQMLRLAKLWLSLPQSHTETHFEKQGHFPTGIAPDIKRFIGRYPDIAENPARAEVMLRSLPVERKEISPKKVRIRLVVDISGSMDEHMELVKELTTSLTGSCVKVNAEANVQGLDFQCALDVLTFGEMAHEPLVNKNPVSLQDMMKVHRSFSQLEGSTLDHLALELIERGLTPAEKKEREQGELFDLVIEITDGDTRDPNKSKAAISRLEKQGLILRAVQLGSGEHFSAIWNFAGKTRGQQIGSSRELAASIEGLLAEEVSALKAKVAVSKPFA